MKKIFMLKPFNGLKARIPRGKIWKLNVCTNIDFFKVKTQSWNESHPPPSLLGMIYNFKKEVKKEMRQKWGII